jgi:hypothetical protein
MSATTKSPAVTVRVVTVPVVDQARSPLTRAVLEARERFEIVKLETSAFAGTTDVKTPKPNDATATSAMRLKVVFVDICFLSISRDREFPKLGFGPKLPSHMS